MHTRGAHTGRRTSWLISLGTWAVLGTLLLHLSWHVASMGALIAESRAATSAVSNTLVAPPKTGSAIGPYRRVRFLTAIPETREAHFTVPPGPEPVVASLMPPRHEVHAAGIAALAPRGRSPPVSGLVAF